ncbi:MAG: hypothetical protein KGQ49_04750, partial [Verrucomicrobia bacterium]|nr:hypothetical protein [Verrucomicrobiota bacterium]
MIHLANVTQSSHASGVTSQNVDALSKINWVPLGFIIGYLPPGEGVRLSKLSRSFLKKFEEY